MNFSSPPPKLDLKGQGVRIRREREEKEVPGQKSWRGGEGTEEKILPIFFSFVQWGKLGVIILTQPLVMIL